MLVFKLDSIFIKYATLVLVKMFDKSTFVIPCKSPIVCTLFNAFDFNKFIVFAFTPNIDKYSIGIFNNFSFIFKNKTLLFYSIIGDNSFI